MMPPFGPEGDPSWTEIIQALLVPLFLLSACASAVWGLQDRYTDAMQTLRALTGEYRDGDEPTRPAALAQMQALVRRARLIHNAVVGFYVAILLQILAAAWVGLMLLGWMHAILPLFVLFEASLAVLLVAIVFTLADVYHSYHEVEEEAREAGIAPAPQRRT